MLLLLNRPSASQPARSSSSSSSSRHCLLPPTRTICPTSPSSGPSFSYLRKLLFTWWIPPSPAVIHPSVISPTQQQSFSFILFSDHSDIRSTISLYKGGPLVLLVMRQLHIVISVLVVVVVISHGVSHSMEFTNECIFCEFFHCYNRE